MKSKYKNIHTYIEWYLYIVGMEIIYMIGFSTIILNDNNYSSYNHTFTFLDIHIINVDMIICHLFQIDLFHVILQIVICISTYTYVNSILRVINIDLSHFFLVVA